MEKSQELIGILQAISIVAKSLAAKLMQIEKEVEAYELTSVLAGLQAEKEKAGKPSCSVRHFLIKYPYGVLP